MSNTNLGIVNEPMTCNAVFHLTDAEVDCIAKTITGKKKKIKSQTVTDFIQVILEHIVMHGITTKPSDKDWLSERTANMSPQQRASYRRGWEIVGNTLKELNNNNKKE